MRVKKLELASLAIVAFYSVALFPSRNHLDTVTAMSLARSGESLDQWTAAYFRFLQLTTLGGRFPFISAILGLVLLTLATRYFIYSFELPKRTKSLAFLVCSASPFVGVFGMTLTHEVQTVTGTLALSGILIRRAYNPTQRLNPILILLSMFLSVMTFVGALICVGFLLAIMNWKNKIKVAGAMTLVALFAMFSSDLLRVTRMESVTGLQSVLGDIKCVAQHPDSVITPSQWQLLESFGEREMWVRPTTCSNTSMDVLFVVPNSSGRELEILKLWAQVARQNPQITLQARFQRAAMALPPPFFQSQPNYSSRNFLEPVGLGTRDDLQQWSPIFKTSNDDPYQKEKFFAPSFAKPLEYIALLPAFIINSQSWFWGWGGFWIIVFIGILIWRTELTYGSIIRIILPHLFTIIGLVIGSPVSDPRYAMTLTSVGLFTTIAYLSRFLINRKSFT